ncbi:MAG: hypothetical protein FWG31_09055 [Oscillospiraceae bacterium]|nr:hypothetical protein [Oscillospiraceae bacterium]
MRKKLLQIGVPAVCGVLLLILYITAPWKSGASEEGGIDTPVRVGTLGEARASLARGYTLQEAVEEADLVLEVTVSSWLGEDLDDGIVTFFDVTTDAVLKGDVSHNIVLIQLGDSKWTYRNYPLYQRGDRLIVFLKNAIGNEFVTDFDLDLDNAYWLLGTYTTVLHVQSTDDVPYALDRHGMLTEHYFYDYGGLLELKEGLSKVSIKERNDFWNIMEAADPLITRLDDSRNTLVRYDELIGEIERFAGQEAVYK